MGGDMVCMRLFRTPTSHNAYTEAAAKEDSWRRTLKSGLTHFLLYKKCQTMQSVIDSLENATTKQLIVRKLGFHSISVLFYTYIEENYSMSLMFGYSWKYDR